MTNAAINASVPPIPMMAARTGIWPRKAGAGRAGTSTMVQDGEQHGLEAVEDFRMDGKILIE